MLHPVNGFLIDLDIFIIKLQKEYLVGKKDEKYKTKETRK
jgi:hypothetical protein